MEKSAQPAALEAALKAKREQGPPSSGKEFSAWLDECMDLEEQLASLRETRRDGPIGPQPVERRPRRIPRAERSPRRRPARLVDGNGLTRRDRAVYAYIRRKAKGAEAVEISNQELAYGTGYKRRSIQLATAALHCAGKVLKRERRVSPTLSLPNQFILPENRRFHEGARRTSQGRKKYAQTPYRDSTSKDTSTETLPSDDGRNRLQGVKDRAERRPLPRRHEVPPAIAELSYADASSVIEGLRRLDAPGAETLDANGLPEVIAGAVEELRRADIPDYPAGLWNAYVRQHGAKAYFAVVETVATHRGLIPRPDGTGPLRRPGAYLSGILRKPTEEVRPAETVRIWLAIAARETPLPSSELGKPVRGDRRELSPGQRRELVAIRAAHQRQEEAEGQRRAELRQAFVEELQRSIGAAAVQQWIEPLSLSRVGLDRVLMAAPSRFISDYVRAQYWWDMARAWGKVLGRAVTVSVMVGTERPRRTTSRDPEVG